MFARVFVRQDLALSGLLKAVLVVLVINQCGSKGKRLYCFIDTIRVKVGHGDVRPLHT